MIRRTFMQAIAALAASLVVGCKKAEAAEPKYRFLDNLRREAQQKLYVFRPEEQPVPIAILSNTREGAYRIMAAIRRDTVDRHNFTLIVVKPDTKVSKYRGWTRLAMFVEKGTLRNQELDECIRRSLLSTARYTGRSVESLVFEV